MSSATATAPATPIEALVEQVEDLAVLDPPGRKIGETVRSRIKPGALKDLLSGSKLGHSIHPPLTDLVIGCWTSATVLDLLGGRASEPAARRLIAVGIAAYPPTALTGVTDYADAEYGNDPVRRVGLVHAATNGVALTLYAGSLRARRRGDVTRGKLLALAGAGLAAAGGYLGGHMAFRQGVGVDQTVFDQGSAEWTEATGAEEVAEGASASAMVGETPLFLHRSAGSLHALHDRCSHRGCPLSAMGEVSDGVVECQCHGSRFRLSDGALLRGPATAPQPAYDTREREGRIEVRLRG